MKHDTDITFVSLFTQSTGLSKLKQIFAMLDELNDLLPGCLAANFLDYCHVGAIDEGRNLVVIFVMDQSIYHLITAQANNILYHFSCNNFYFSSILIKVTPYNSNNILPANNKLDHIARNKLKSLASAINRPDLIKNDPIITLNEPEIQF